MTTHADAPVPVPTAHRGVRAPRWWPPVGLAAAATGVSLALAVRSPHVPGSWGWCPLLVTTGLWCPACGGLRAVHELVRGDLGAALAMNPAVVAGLPLVAAVWLWWLLGTLGRRPTTGLAGVLVRLTGRLVSVRAGWFFLVLAVLFTVLRNVPGMDVLAPG